MNLVNWQNIVGNAVQMLIVSVFSVLLINTVLGEKSDKVKLVIKWSAVICLMQLVLFITTLGMDMLDVYITTNRQKLWETQSLQRFAVIALYILYNTFTMLIPTIIALLGALWTYRKERSVKIFTAVLAGLYMSIATEYIAGIFTRPFMTEEAEKQLKTDPPLWITVIILTMCLGGSYVLFKQWMNKKLRSILDTPDGRIDSFVKIPVMSGIIFALLISTLSTFGIARNAKNWMDTLIYLVVFGCLIFAYVLMYWSIFRGITLSTEATKNRAELDVAKKIQAAVLPSTFPAFPERSEFNIYATMTPAKEVGGDFYDFFFVDSQHLALVIADVSGKGVPAALFMMTARTLLHNLVTSGKSPEQALFEANNSLCQNNEAEMFVTAWLGILEIDSGRLIFANAGHNPPLIKQQDGNCIFLDYKKYKRGIMLGMRDHVPYYANQITLGPGELLFLYTDGITEACTSDQVLFGEHRLKQTIEESKGSAQQLIIRMQGCLDEFVGKAEQFDDITLLGIQLSAGAVEQEVIKSLSFSATVENTAKVSAFVEQLLEDQHCEVKLIHKALIAVDEIYSNIIRYIGAGKVDIHCSVSEDFVSLTFEDDGKAYNPLEAKAPDITASLGERDIGGLGVYVVKKTMDAVSYDYHNEKNVLTIKKNRM